jgi:RHS repeat-associated protein
MENYMSKANIKNSSKAIFLQDFKLMCSAALTLFVFFISVSNCFGQTQGAASIYTPASVAPGTPVGSYPLSGFESINPYSGKLNFSLPLYNVGGRGEIGYTQNLVMEKNWNVAWTSFYTYPGPPPTGQPGQWRLEDNLWNEPQNINASGVMLGRKSRDRNPTDGGSPVCYTLSRISWISQNKTEIEMRDELTGGTPNYHYDNYLYPRGSVFKSYEGSNLTFVSDSAINDMDCGDTGFSARNGIVRFSPSGYLYFPNGVKYRIVNGSVSWMEDRNGNHLEINGKDILGRTPNTYGVGGVEKKITFNGTSLSQRLRTGYTSKTTQELFPNLPSANGGPGLYYFNANPDVTSEVVLPDGRKYEFYYNSYAELARIVLPTGGAIEYDWGPPCTVDNIYCFESGLFTMYSNNPFIRRVVRERRSYKEDGTLENRTTFRTPLLGPLYSESGATSTIVNFDGAGHQLSKTIYYYYGSGTGNGGWYSSYTTGRAYKTEIYDENNNLLRVVEDTWTESSVGAGPANPQLIQSTTTLVETNQVSKKTFAYDGFNNQTDVWEYDYGTGQSTQLLRRTHTDYINDPNYILRTGAYQLILPSQKWVSSDYNGTTKASLTQFEYDNYVGGNNAPLVSRTSVIGHNTANYDADKTIRGNVTKVTTYANAQNQTEPVSTYFNYDILGNVVKATDAKGNASTIDYADRFGSPDGEARSNSAPTQLNGQSTFAFPTSATNALGWTTYSQFDYFTGKAVNTEDINGVISKTIYNDLLDRVTQTVTAIGTALEMQSNIVYDDANHRIETKSDLNALNDNLIKSESFYDGLGRTIKSQNNDAQGNVISEVIYDSLGRVWKTTNPYREGGTKKWREIKYDVLSRETDIITPDGATFHSEYGGATSGSQIGETVTTTDQSGKKRRSIVDGLGRLIRVDEADDNGNMGTVSSPNRPTVYTYDVLGSLIQTTKGQQTRTFVYDSLKRLVSSTNPESGTVTQKYDANGNLTEKKDARNVITTITYDPLNRPTFQDYSDTTPDVTFTYDNSNIANSKGKLTKVDNGISSSENTSFDITGKLLSANQTTDSQVYSLSYKYNLSGMLTEQIYPSGRVVKNIVDSDGDLFSVASKSGTGGAFKNYASNFSFTPSGGISSMMLGNGKWESTVFNDRLQTTQIALGNAPNATDLLKLNYNYGTTDNNGNVKSQTITVPNVGTSQGFTAIQNYTYDPLNRLKTASETIGGNQTWKQGFLYDQHGNRNFNMSETNTLPQGCSTEVCNPLINQTKNRIADNQGYDYDPAGNITKNAENNRFVYNADNKITEVRDATTNALIEKYYYDGAGMRVKTVAGNLTTIYVFGGGEMVAEYTLNGTPAANPTTNYLTTDYLGSPRIITDAHGQIVSRRDLMPFGEEIYAGGAGGRSTTQKYGVNEGIKQKFTGQLRDEAVKLDYFNARSYGFSSGRFMSADNFGGRLSNPQTLNLYVYAINNPMRWVDPTGHSPDDPCTLGSENCHQVDNENKILDYSLPAENVDVKWQGGEVQGEDLQSSGVDYIPVYGNFRRAIWNMKSDGGADVGRSLYYFGMTALDVVTVLSGAKAVTTAVRAVAGETLAETLANGRNVIRNGIRTLVGGAEEATEGAATKINCFIAGTLIHTINGLVAIENIRAGDKVLSYDTDIGQAEYQSVVKIFRNVADAFLRISVEDEQEPITVTLGHPFYVHQTRNDLSGDDDGEWILSKDLQVGNLLRLVSGEWKPILSIEQVQQTRLTYNFEVAKNHDYFVGQSGWLVHNQSTNTVYRSVINGETNYVGITNNLERRTAEHAADLRGFNIEPIVDGLSRQNARAVEQALIENYGLERNGGQLVNRINSIAPTRPNYQQMVQQGNNILNSIGFTP